jgi:hypothetical protein
LLGVERCHSAMHTGHFFAHRYGPITGRVRPAVHPHRTRSGPATSSDLTEGMSCAPLKVDSERSLRFEAREASYRNLLCAVAAFQHHRSCSEATHVGDEAGQSDRAIGKTLGRSRSDTASTTASAPP